LRYKHANFVLIDEGPDISTSTVFVIQNNACTGYTILDKTNTIENPENLINQITPTLRHPVIDQKIRMFIQKKKYEQIIPFKPFHS